MRGKSERARTRDAEERTKIQRHGGGRDLTWCCTAVRCSSAEQLGSQTAHPISNTHPVLLPGIA
eukprot:2547030-Rhodomonas_salina.1